MYVPHVAVCPCPAMVISFLGVLLFLYWVRSVEPTA
jgi:hypothetical protein